MTPDELGTFPVKTISCQSWDGRNVRLTDSFTFSRPKRVGGEAITFLPRSESDGASVPRAIELLGLTHDGVVWPAAVGHDAMYRGYVLVNGVRTLVTKEKADLVFYEMCRANGMADLLAREYYNGVAEAGGHAFTEDRAALAASEDGRRRDVSG